MDPVAIVGTSPASEVLAATLADASIPHDRREDPEFADASLGVVVDHVGADAFAVADDAARDADVPWLAIELGGIGGYPLVEASVAGLEPDGPCYDCLAGRVEANADPDAEPVPAPGGETARLASAIAGRELVSTLEPGHARPVDRTGETIFGRVIEVPHAERTVLPLPGCSCGSDPDRSVRHEYEDVGLDAALARGERGLDDRVGIVAAIGEAQSYPAPYYLAELCETSGFSDASASRQAAGVATGWDAAFTKALGESFERYAAAVYRTDSFEHATADALDACVPPSAFVAPDDRGRIATDGRGAGAPADEGDADDADDVEGSDDDPTLDGTDDADAGKVGDAEGWLSGPESEDGDDSEADEAAEETPAVESAQSTTETTEEATLDDTDSATGDEDGPAAETGQATDRDADAIAWYPAEELATGAETYVPADLVVHPPPSTGVRPAITTGLGLGSSGTGALLSGLYEVIERDATMLAWYSTYEPLGLTVEDEDYRTLARRVEADGLSVTPLLVTQDVDVPVVAVAVHRETYPKLAFGSAAHLDPHSAARDALAEAVQNWMELQTMGEEAATEAKAAIGRYASDPEPATAWLEPETTTPAATVGSKTPPSGQDAVETVIDRLAEAELSAYGARTTTRDLAAIGFEGVRVLVPRAQPLFLGEPFFGQRASQVPDSLGFEPRPEREHHPFP